MLPYAPALIALVAACYPGGAIFTGNAPEKQSCGGKT
jgi:hypothetical protein